MSYVAEVGSVASRVPVIRNIRIRDRVTQEVLLPSDTIGFQMITHKDPGEYMEYVVWNFAGITSVGIADDSNQMNLPFGQNGGIMGLKLKNNLTLYLNATADCDVEIIIFLTS